MNRIISLLLCILMLTAALISCSEKRDLPDGSDLMEGIEAKVQNDIPKTTDGSAAVSATDFAVRLFKSTLESDKNTLISPVSVLYALSMTANGADGETLSQMESVLGMDISELNFFLKAYADALPEGEKYKLSIANSIWFTDDDRFSVNRDFLQTTADYYGAEIYTAPFNDATSKSINSWVKNKTDGMIKKILENISPSAVMYLVNAMAFDAEWQSIYYDHQVKNGTFTTENGTERKVKMMHSDEHQYLDDGNATGFIKNYADAKYAFAALLPNEGMSVSEYIETLTGEGLSALLRDPSSALVKAAMPKFENEYDVEMSDVLKNMGMTDAFDANTADFSRLGTSSAGNICISRVIHKTFISVDERGTRAGAATLVETYEGAAMVDEIKEVTLDRPFVYMIIDREADLPLFIGTVMDIE